MDRSCFKGSMKNSATNRNRRSIKSNILLLGFGFNSRVCVCVFSRVAPQLEFVWYCCFGDLHCMVTPLAVAGIQQLRAQEYGQITRMLGNGRCDVQCVDGVKRLHISSSSVVSHSLP